MSAAASTLGRTVLEEPRRSPSRTGALGTLPLDAETAGRFVETAVRDHLPKAASLFITLPAPLAAPEAILHAAGTDMGFLWAPSSGPTFSGSGCAHAIQLQGTGRPAALRQQAEVLFEGIRSVDYPPCQAPPPRLFGGLAFQPGSSREEPWQEFGDGGFILPRWLYTRRLNRATLSLTLMAEDGPSLPRYLGELRHILESLAADLPASGPLPAPLRVDSLPLDRWAGQVESIRSAIEAGTFRKIVAARRSTVELQAPLDPLAVLHRLHPEQIRGCLRFAFFRPGSSFLGATPERLIARSGDRIETEALAGSIGSGERQGDRLLSSLKDLGEHALVVEHLVGRLRPLCDTLDWSAQPRIRELRNLLHLHTPIRGHLHEDTHILDLVATLHPTPAVAGVPTQPAVRWISERETTPRGWYAGPIGWFDAAGDGEFDVALRSCLLAGSTVWLFAGAGIMLDSDPELEYQETALKQRSLLAALGVGE